MVLGKGWLRCTRMPPWRCQPADLKQTIDEPPAAGPITTLRPTRAGGRLIHLTTKTAKPNKSGGLLAPGAACPRTVSLLKSPFLLRQLMLRAALGTLLGHGLRAALAPADPPNLACSRAALHLEILALRHQLDVLQRTRPQRVRLARTDRWLWVMLARVWAGWRTALVS